MSAQKEKLPSWVSVILAGAVLIFVFIGILVSLPKEVKESSVLKEATIQKRIHWVKHQEILAPVAEWSKNYSTPSGLFKIMPASGEKVEVLFSNGKYFLLNYFEQIDMGYVSEKYKVRGIGKESKVYVFIGKKM